MKRLSLVVLVAAALLPACRSNANIELVTIGLYLDTGMGFRPMTITPDIPLEVAEYHVTGSGPASSTLELATSGSSCVIEDILPGEWTFNAEGYNAAGDVLFSGGTTTAVDRETGEITIVLSEPAGEGTLSLAFSWEEGLVTSPDLTVELEKDETTIGLTPIISGGTATVEATLDAGLYEMTALLSDNGEQRTGAADYVKIAAGYDTAGLIELHVVLIPVSPLLSLQAPELSPLGVAITGFDLPIFTGTQVTLQAVAPAGPGAVFTWFVDGIQAATGAELILDTTAPSTRRIDVLAWADGFASGGSATLEVSVHDPVFYGSLVFVESIIDNKGAADGLSGARDLAVSGNYLYTAGYGEDEIGVYEIDEVTGKLTFTTIIGTADVPEPALFSRPSCLTVSTAGLAAGCSGGGALFLFEIKPDTGELSLLDAAAPVASDFAVPAGGPGNIPADLNPLLGVSAITYDQVRDIVFASSQDSDTITSYRIDNGVLTPYQIVSGEALAAAGFDSLFLDGPEALALSPDGAFLAGACRSSDNLLIFEISATDGVLSPVASFADGLDGVDGLNGANGVCFSRDGRDIYVTGYYDDAVSLFSKEPVTGAWTYVDTWDDVDFPGAALHYPRGIAVSPDGTEIYVCASGSDALTVFSREPTTGTLSTPASAVDGNDRNIGFDGIRRVISAGGGDYLYAVSSNDNAAVMFRRE